MVIHSDLGACYAVAMFGYISGMKKIILDQCMVLITDNINGKIFELWVSNILAIKSSNWKGCGCNFTPRVFCINLPLIMKIINMCKWRMKAIGMESPFIVLVITRAVNLKGISTVHLLLPEVIRCIMGKVSDLTKVLLPRCSLECLSFV